MSKEERLNININKGKRKKLSRSMGLLFGIPYRNIQIGATTLTSHGFYVKIVHFVYPSQLIQDVNDDEEDDEITPKQYIKQLYSRLQNEINDLFRSHFNLNQDFCVQYQFKLSTLHKAISIDPNHSFIHQNEGEINNDKNNTTEMEMIQQQSNDNNADDDNDEQDIVIDKVGNDDSNIIDTMQKHSK